MADEISPLEKRVKETLVELQDSIPRIQQELTDFINLVKNINDYKDTLDPIERKILAKHYSSVFIMVKPGLCFIEDFNLPTSSLLKTLALISSGKFTENELFTIMDKWIVPYYTKKGMEGKPTIELLHQVLIFLRTIYEFTTRRQQMIRLLSEASGLDSIKFQASNERGPVALLIQFLAWHQV